MNTSHYARHAQQQELIDAYAHAERPIIFSDYDGVLREIESTPEAASPTPDVIAAIGAVASDPETVFVGVSGRDHETLDAWLGKQLDIELSAEHGALRKNRDGTWVVLHGLEPKEREHVLALMSQAAQDLPGASVEKKLAGIAYHYRIPSLEHPAEARLRAEQLMADLADLDMSFGILDGSMVVEAHAGGVDKGVAVRPWLENTYDFVLAMGDDTTDAKMIAAIEASGIPQRFTIAVGEKELGARLRLPDPSHVRDLLDAMSRARRSQQRAS
jgi:trehalose 6-phosphate synthase/phosphatase